MDSSAPPRGVSPLSKLYCHARSKRPARLYCVTYPLCRRTMETRLLVLITSFALWGVSCSSSSATASSSGDLGSIPCHGPGCGSSTDAAIGGSSSKDGSTSVVNGSSGPDGGTLWSTLCGPQNIGCLPGPNPGVCGNVYAATSNLDAGADGGPADAYGANTGAGITLTCRVRSVADAPNVERACEGAGKGKSGDPCLSTLGCGVGLTCVSDGLAAVCLPYCCADPESCANDSYCTTRKTTISTVPPVAGPDVPVCALANSCPLNEPYPCPQNKTCTCPTGKACMVVRRQGLTACVTPGTGKQGDYCPCAAGYVCSNSTFTCLQLCQLGSLNASNASNAGCLTGTTCQASNDVPSGWGVCNDVPMLIN